jgi:predicted dehydrogenase
MSKIVQIGMGSIGRRHYKNLLKLGMPYVGIADPAIIENIINTYNPRKLLGERAEGNIVVIASPTEFHLEQLDMADHYKAKAIFLEKPPHYNASDLEKFMESHNPKCAVGFNYRFHPEIRHLKSIMSIGPTVRLLMLAYDDVENWPNWSEDSWLNGEYGGALLTSASHSVDTALYLLGEVESLKCRLWCKKSTNLTVDMTLWHTCGAKTQIEIRWNGPKHSSIAYVDDKQMILRDMTRYAEYMHYDCMKDFLKFVDGKKSEICTLKQSLEVMKILDLAKASNGEILHCN